VLFWGLSFFGVSFCVVVLIWGVLVVFLFWVIIGELSVLVGVLFGVCLCWTFWCWSRISAFQI